MRLQTAALAAMVCLLASAPARAQVWALTFTNAAYSAWRRCRDEETRRLLLLQNVAFLPMFRRSGGATAIDTLEPIAPAGTGPGAVEELFAEMSRNRATAARKVLGYLERHPDPRPFADAARRLIFLKRTDSHDYKYSSAVLEDYALLAPSLRRRFLAASAFHLKGTGEPDNPLVERIRAALA